MTGHTPWSELRHKRRDAQAFDAMAFKISQEGLDYFFDVELDDIRDARHMFENDRIWGVGNWVRCSICPRDACGREVYHHRDAHT